MSGGAQVVPRKAKIGALACGELGKLGDSAAVEPVLTVAFDQSFEGGGKPMKCRDAA